MSTAHADRVMRRTASGLVPAVVVAATFSLTVLGQAPSLRPGKYEKTSETAMQGRPSKNVPKNDVVCLSDQDVKDIGKTALADDRSASCKDSVHKVAGTTTTFTRTCAAADGNTFVVDVTVTFTSPESYHGVATIKNVSGGLMKAAEGATTTTTAKRIGDCTK